MVKKWTAKRAPNARAGKPAGAQVRQGGQAGKKSPIQSGGAGSQSGAMGARGRSSTK
jgi:hypothetical protein